MDFRPFLDFLHDVESILHFLDRVFVGELVNELVDFSLTVMLNLLSG